MRNTQITAQAVAVSDVEHNGRSSAAPAVADPPRTTRARAREQLDPRTRMLAAMVELVGEQGFASTTVADVIERARASRRTFYEYFANAEACFLVACEEASARWLQRTSAAVEDVADDGDAADEQEDAVSALVEEIFELTLAHPGELRLLNADLPAIERIGIERREQVFTGLGATLSRALDVELGTGSANGAGNGHGHGHGHGHGQTILLEGSLAARVLAGAIVRVAYARAMRGGRVRRPARAQLLALTDDLADWAAACCSAVDADIAVPQPAGAGGAAAVEGAAAATSAAAGPLLIGGRAPGTLSLSSRAVGRRGLPRGESAVSRSFVVHNQRERLLDAVANLSAAKGYGAVTIPEIVHEAAVSVEAFYEHFSGREDALLVAYELGRRKTLAVVEGAFLAEDSWVEGVRAGIGALFAFLGSEPSFAHLALIDVPAAGGKPAAQTRRGALVELLQAGIGQDPRARDIPEVAIEASAGAVSELCYVYAAAGRTRELPSLIELASQLALAPFTAAGAISR